MNIFLIRHGESMQNTGENYKKKLPDNKVYLTETGKEQAKEAGIFLDNFFKENKINKSKTTLWISPYERTRETAKIINESLKIKDIKEDVTLIEQRYGLFGEDPMEECKIKYPDQFNVYNNYYQNESKFYARLPQGDSPFDVTLRMKQFIETLFRDIKEEGKETFIIVSHGTTIRAFLLAWFHYSPEWFNNEKNMKNCSIRYIKKENNISKDYEYIYGERE